jgi:hypothetical protein
MNNLSTLHSITSLSALTLLLADIVWIISLPPIKVIKVISAIIMLVLYTTVLVLSMILERSGLAVMVEGSTVMIIIGILRNRIRSYRLAKQTSNKQ